jgi:glutathione-specific gamma-glutamylcyclotransferase
MDLTPELVARAFRAVAPLPKSDGWTWLTEDRYAQILDGLMAERPEGPVWVFGYGSLIWNPEFEVGARRRGRAHGWHRQFCMEMQGWRGTPETPGLMMALIRGGTCEGVLLEAVGDTPRRIVERMIRREINAEEDVGMLRWARIDTADGPVKALLSWAGPRGPGISPNLALPEVARRLAQACGPRGSCAEYLFQTVAGLEEHGIRDRNLWTLQSLVARHLSEMSPD